MATEEIRWAIASGFFIFILMGCTTTNFNEDGNSIPDGWTVPVSHNAQHCNPIGGVYQNVGVGKFREGVDLKQARLDAALGYVFPTVKMPHQVSIEVNEDSNVIQYHFLGPENQSFSTTVNCLDGWYKSEQKVSDHYVGDGATLDYSNRKIELGKSSDGELIVHVLLETQFSSFLVFKSFEIRESWSIYEKAKSEH